MLVLLLVVLIHVSCNDDEDTSFCPCELEPTSQFECVMYHETFCADPWGNDSNDKILVDNLNTFFESLDVKLSQIRIEDRSLEVSCAACNCPSGRIIHAHVNKSELDIVIEKGFIKKE